MPATTQIFAGRCTARFTTDYTPRGDTRPADAEDDTASWALVESAAESGGIGSPHDRRPRVEPTDEMYLADVTPSDGTTVSDRNTTSDETTAAAETTASGGDTIPDRSGSTPSDAGTGADDVEETDSDTRVYHGHVVVVRKPDDTVLVHDADGYQPVAWLTRAESVTVVDDGGGVTLTAVEEDERLAVAFEDAYRTSHRVTSAGPPVSPCPSCGETMVRANGGVRCLRCSTVYALPSGATVLERPCSSCGAPRIRVRRGRVLELCVDRECDPLVDAVSEALDGVACCPECDSPLRVETYRGRPFLGCAEYPSCDTTFSIPNGELAGDCTCGLPRFQLDTGNRCLDPTCDAVYDTGDEEE